DRTDPTPDHGLVRIVSWFAPGSAQNCFAGVRCRQCCTTLPPVRCKNGERVESYAFLLLKLSGSISPRTLALCCGSRLLLLGNKLETCLQLPLFGLSRKENPVKLLNSGHSVLRVFCSLCEVTSLLGNKWAVEKEQ